jgi:hypothetical protein
MKHQLNKSYNILEFISAASKRSFCLLMTVMSIQILNGYFFFKHHILPPTVGSRIGTVELQHPLLPLDIIDNI